MEKELMKTDVTALTAPRQAGAEVAVSRAAQEVQAAMVVAKRFPRDETAAFARVMEACRRKSLAEMAIYEYARGGQSITGPSIRLAEVLARAWGNIDAGIVEVEQRDGESTMLAYAWDLETNSRVSRSFVVRHERYSKAHGTRRVTDARDVYEVTANQSARRLRATLLAVIPGDLVEAALAECEKTMTTGHTESLGDRAKKMVDAFQRDLAVSQAMIEARLGHPVRAVTETELARLRKIYASLRDGVGSRDDFFAPPTRSGARALDAVLAPEPPPAPEPPKEEVTPMAALIEKHLEDAPMVPAEDPGLPGIVADLAHSAGWNGARLVAALRAAGLNGDIPRRDGRLDLEAVPHDILVGVLDQLRLEARP